MRLSRGKDVNIGEAIFTLGLSAGIHASKLATAKVGRPYAYPSLPYPNLLCLNLSTSSFIISQCQLYTSL